MTYNVFGGTLSLTQSINLRRDSVIVAHIIIVLVTYLLHP